MSKKLTLRAVQQELRDLDIILTKKDGEYRVNFRGGSEATAAYESDPDGLEAIRGTGLAMARERMREVEACDLTASNYTFNARHGWCS